MKILNYIAIAAALALTGCAAVSIQPQASFNAEQAAKLAAPGKNTIKGSALLRQVAGGVVTCAGRKVDLIPATDYATERIVTLYKSADRGFNPAGVGSTRVNFLNTPPEYNQLIRSTTCDAQGFFKFDKVADGDFYVTSLVVWQINPYFLEGGYLMQRVSVSGGETKEIVLSR